MKTKLETQKLRTGTVLIRPAGTLGTCGWHPKPWQVAVKDQRRRINDKATFLEWNRNWTAQEIE